MQFDSTAVQILIKGIGEALYMVFLSSALSCVISIPSGIALVAMDKDGISPVLLFNKVLGPVINVLRSIPFIILLIMVIPITRMIASKIIGCNITVVPLVTTAVPCTGCMVESSLREVDAGIIEAVKPMGVPTWQIIARMLLPETKPSLLVEVAISVTTVLGYSAITGFTDGGDSGDITIRYGYHRYQTDMTTVIAVSLIITVQLIQEVFMRVSRRDDKGIRWSRACLIRTATGGTGKTGPVGRNQ